MPWFCDDGVPLVGLLGLPHGEQNLLADAGNCTWVVVKSARSLGIGDRLGLLSHCRQSPDAPVPVSPPNERRFVEQLQQLLVSSRRQDRAPDLNCSEDT